MFVPKNLLDQLQSKYRHYSTKQTNFQQEPFKFYTYNGNLLNLRANEKFKSYHIISTEYPYKFNGVSEFLETRLKTQNKINGKKVMEEISLNLSYLSVCRQQPAKSIFFTSGIYNNGEKNHDAIIIHCEDENNKEFEWLVDSMINSHFHKFLLTK